jgi:hypothetical protein
MQPLVVAFGAVVFAAGAVLYRFRNEVFDHFDSRGVTHSAFGRRRSAVVSPAIRRLVSGGWMALGVVIMLLGLVLPPYEG